MGYEWDFRFLWQYLPALFKGVLITLELTAVAVAGGTLLGVLVAVLRDVGPRPLRWLIAIYVEIGLATPLLILLIWINYCGPLISNLLAFNGFTVASIALVINLAPFVGETLRSGFATLPDSYALAARAVAMNSWQTFSRVTFPLALRRSFPSLIAQYVTTLKLVSLCSIIAVPEIVHTSSAIISKEFRPLEVYTAMGVIYLVTVLPFTILSRFWEKRLLVKN